MGGTICKSLIRKCRNAFELLDPQMPMAHGPCMAALPSILSGCSFLCHSRKIFRRSAKGCPWFCARLSSTEKRQREINSRCQPCCFIPPKTFKSIPSPTSMEQSKCIKKEGSTTATTGHSVLHLTDKDFHLPHSLQSMGAIEHTGCVVGYLHEMLSAENDILYSLLHVIHEPLHLFYA